MRRRSLPSILLLLLVGVLVFGAASVASAEKVKVRIWGMNTAVPGGARNQVKVFNETHNHIELVPEVPTIQEGTGSGTASGGTVSSMQKLLTAIAAGNPPDITTVDRFAISSWADRNALMSLDDFIQRDAFDMSRYYKFAIDEITVDNSIYALPTGGDGRYLLWNKDIFAKAGLDPEKPPQTWEEVLEYGKLLTVKRGSRSFEQLGFVSQLAPAGTFYLLTILNGGGFLSEDGRTITLTEPEVVEALEWMVEWYDELGGAENINAFLGAFQIDTANDPFALGKVAQIITGDWVLGNLARYKPDLNFGIAPPPAAKPEYYGRTWFGGWGWAIPRGAKNADAAWEVIKWLCSEEGTRAFDEGEHAYRASENLPFVPGISALKGMNEANIELVRDELSIPFLEAMEFRASNIGDDNRVRHITPVGSELYARTGRAVDAAIHHKQTPADALKEAQVELQKMLDDYYAKQK